MKTKKNTTKKNAVAPAKKNAAPVAPAKGKKGKAAPVAPTATTATAPKGWDSVGTTTPGGKGKKGKTAPVAPAPAPKKNAAPVAPVAPVARQTKKGDALELLKKGVSLEHLMTTFGWQRHTVRGFISILGKTHKIESTSVEGVRTYKIAGGK